MLFWAIIWYVSNLFYVKWHWRLCLRTCKPETVKKSWIQCAISKRVKRRHWSATKTFDAFVWMIPTWLLDMRKCFIRKCHKIKWWFASTKSFPFNALRKIRENWEPRTLVFFLLLSRQEEEIKLASMPVIFEKKLEKMLKKNIQSSRDFKASEYEKWAKTYYQDPYVFGTRIDPIQNKLVLMSQLGLSKHFRSRTMRGGGKLHNQYLFIFAKFVSLCKCIEIAKYKTTSLNDAETLSVDPVLPQLKKMSKI